ncbi:aldo/keto reductase [Angustibacter sp. McL0619]|uniref:aldo/keto reductase n=1 Tax=Angustibacter sp. McL0619 TaxID=3415676 RepID=UPI003CE98B1D
MTMSPRPLGRTGLMVSPLTLGTMEFGGKTDQDDARAVFGAALDAGINVVDTANVYGRGISEEIVGALIKPLRDRLLLATKFSVPMDDRDPNSGGTSRRAVIAACEASLRRLGTDHIDLYYIHRPSTQTAIDETLRALDDLVRAGKIRYVGTSGFSGWQVVEALWCAHDLRIARPAVEQVAYHLLDRRAERDLVPAALSHGTALTVWSPLAGGLLTGKYLDGQQSLGSRLTPDNPWGAKHFTPAADTAVRALAEVARGVGVPLTALSLAWTLQRPGVASLVIGPRSVEQLGGLLEAVDVVLAPDVCAAIDEIVPPGGVTVPYYLDDDFADFRPQPYGW